ncbi:cytochrome oxidase [Salipiger aestuarii]|uniref:Cytochrome aa3 subunit 2 n=1 Tax=Salipiger aestuarii TaxID=568098 RepID=A0A327Y6E2_9RHOB|nr:cytochrome c oxidase subunit II [Salipiger aestuarii]KAB2541716.1 cytochrome oxidase [Salipiger aestuarii]RAK15305.1 cytochrome c oxidase subunit 2 [Salipiger aestuarii]
MRNLTLLTVPLLAGCAGRHNWLSSAGAEADRVEGLFWVLLIGAAVIWSAVIGAAVYAQRRQVDPGLEHQARWFIVWGGAVIPTVLVCALLIWGLVILRDITPDKGDLTVRVDGERWWWRVTYDGPDGDVVTANEIRLPLDQTALFRLTSDDVIHSFWVPAIGGKMDMIPGRETTLALTPNKTGNWGGLCAEYCGGAHALMRFDTVVMEPDAFDAWLAAEAAPARVAPDDPGFAVFRDEGCGACHTIRGTDARGPVGPDLTHVGARARLGAGIYAMTADNMARWITDTHAMKPDADMPPYPDLSGARLEALVTFLLSLDHAE